MCVYSRGPSLYLGPSAGPTRCFGRVFGGVPLLHFEVFPHGRVVEFPGDPHRYLLCGGRGKFFHPRAPFVGRGAGFVIWAALCVMRGRLSLHHVV